MKKNSLFVNLIMNLLRMTTSMIIPIILLPFLAVHIGVKGIGMIQYLDSIVNYLMLFTTLGIPTYGIIVIAKNRDDMTTLTLAFLELLSLLVIASFIIGTLYFIFLITSDIEQKKIFYVYGLYLFSQSVNIDWFFQGLEEQVFITLRLIFLKLLMLITVFIFIKNDNDIFKYACVLLSLSIASNIVCFARVLKHVKITTRIVKNISFYKHLKPCIIIVFGSIFASCYNALDAILLGNMVPFTYLGYYTFSLKLSKFAISVIAVINAITLPRLSNLFSLKEESKYYEFSNQLYNIYVYLSVPIATFLFIMAKDMVIAFAGSNFLPSVLTLRILSVTVVVSSIAYFTRFSILFVNQAESCYTISAIFASITCIIINFLLIPFLFQNATAIGNVVAEVVSLSIMCTLGKKYFNKVKLFNLEVVKTLLLSIILGIVLCVFKSFMTISSLQKIIVIVLIYAICYCAFSSFMKIEAYKFGCVRIRKLTSSVLKSVRGSSKTPV